jgi:hypothetical protein
MPLHSPLAAEMLDGVGVPVRPINPSATIDRHPATPSMVHEILGLQQAPGTAGADSHGPMNHPKKKLTGKG